LTIIMFVNRTAVTTFPVPGGQDIETANSKTQLPTSGDPARPDVALWCVARVKQSVSNQHLQAVLHSRTAELRAATIIMTACQRLTTSPQTAANQQQRCVHTAVESA
jgi:hypothetical protein